LGLRSIIQQVRTTTVGALDEWAPPTSVANHADGWRPDEPDAYCPRCGASAGPGSVLGDGCPFCRDKPIAWQRLIRLGLYREPLDDWIRAMKFEGRWSWAAEFGRLLADRVGKPFDEARHVVVPVPMHWRRRWRRGYNQAALIARALAKARRWRMIDLLMRTRPTAPQTTVPPSSRHANVRNSFGIAAIDLTGWEVVLVDDVKTSGATLSACTRLLRKAGARSVTAAVAAVADPRAQDFEAS